MSARSLQILVLLAAAVLLRLLFHTAYLPWWAGDSSGYAAPAAFLYHGQLGNYDGGRTPTYPVFLFLCELLTGTDMTDKLTPLAGQIVVWAQTLLGLGSVVLVYLTMERLEVRASIRFVLAFFYALLAPVAQFEMIILSELLSLFCLVLSVYLMAVVMDQLRRNRPAGGMALLAGLAAGATVLARPNLLFIWGLFFVTLPLLGCLGLIQRLGSPPWARLWKAGGLCAAGGAVLIAACMTFNYENTDNFGLTPMTGISRSFAAYNLFNRVHPRDKVLGDIMDKYYHLANQHGVAKRDYLWQAMPDIWTHYQEMPIRQDPARLHTIYLANYLGSVSNYLMRENSGIWLRNGWEQVPGTFDFNMPQTAPDDKGRDPISLTGTPVVTNAGAWKKCVMLGQWEAPILLGAYLLTFAALIVGAVRVGQARDYPSLLLASFAFNLALGTIISMVIFCFLAAYYSLPLFPEFILCSAYILETVAPARAKDS